MGTRELPNPLRHDPAALGHDLRGAHQLAVVLQGHGQGRRVGDDHVGLGHRGHHALLGELPLLLPDLVLDLRVPLHLAELLLDLLTAHPDRPLELPLLIHVVDQGHDQEHRRQAHRKGPEHVPEGGASMAEGELHGPQGVGKVVPDGGVDHDGEHRRLQQPLEQFHQRAQRDDLLHPADRVEAVQVDLEGLARDGPAHLPDDHRHGQDGDQPSQGEPGQKIALDRLQGQDGEPALPQQNLIPHETNGELEQREEKPIDEGPQEEQGGQPRQDPDGGRQVPAHADAPLRAHLLALLGRGRLGPLLGEELEIEGDGPPPSVGALSQEGGHGAPLHARTLVRANSIHRSNWV